MGIRLGSWLSRGPRTLGSLQMGRRSKRMGLRSGTTSHYGMKLQCFTYEGIPDVSLEDGATHVLPWPCMHLRG